MLFSRKKKKPEEIKIDYSDIQIFNEPKDKKQFGFYEGTKVQEEYNNQKRGEYKEDSGYVGLFKPEDLEDDDLLPKKSVAKTFGTKYISNGKQIASSIVVDVRSYKKEQDESGGYDDVLEKPKDEPKKRSFFDDLLKELEEDESGKDEPVEEPEPIASPPPKPVEKPKKVVSKSKPKKKKKSIDIDIISGDFGGTDII